MMEGRIPVVNVEALKDGKWRDVLGSCEIDPDWMWCRVEAEEGIVCRAELRRSGELEPVAEIEGARDLEYLSFALRVFAGRDVPIEGDGRIFLEFAVDGRVVKTHPATLARAQELRDPFIYAMEWGQVAGRSEWLLSLVTNGHMRVDSAVVTSGEFGFAAIFDGGVMVGQQPVTEDFGDWAVYAGFLGVDIYLCRGAAETSQLCPSVRRGGRRLEDIYPLAESLVLERRDFLPLRETGNIDGGSPAAAFAVVETKTGIVKPSRRLELNGDLWPRRREPAPAWMTAAPDKWRLSVRAQFECGGGDKPLGIIECVLPDFPDEAASVEELAEAPAAVSRGESTLRVHLGERCWNIGYWEWMNLLLPGPDADLGNYNVYVASLCSDRELAEALGLTGKPRPARLVLWEVERLKRDERGWVVESSKILPDWVVAAGGKTSAGMASWPAKRCR